MSETGTKRPGKGFSPVMLRWLALWPVTFGLAAYPVSNGALRVLTLAMLGLLWAGGLYLAWHVKWLRMVALGLPALLLAFLVLPGQQTDRVALRESYTASLRSYEACRYIWGGENRLGIDCSGLVRAALINASIRESIQTMNPALLRFGLDLWWQDCSARALGEGHRQQTTLQFNDDAINAIDPSPLQPGDLAVTENGIHVLAYLGADQWIEADPEIGRVIILTVPSTNGWFDTPVNIVRWRILDGPSGQN